MADLTEVNQKCAEIRNTLQSVVPEACQNMFNNAGTACGKVAEAESDRNKSFLDYKEKLDAWNKIKVNNEAEVQAAIDLAGKTKAETKKAIEEANKQLVILKDLLNNVSSSGQSYNNSSPLSANSIAQMRKMVTDQTNKLNSLYDQLNLLIQTISNLEAKLVPSKEAKHNLDIARASLNTDENLLDTAVENALKAYNEYKQCKANSNPYANAAVTSGNIASGQIGQYHLASGIVSSGHIGDAAVVSGSIASG